VAPLTFIYVRSVLKQQYHLKRKDLLLFVPAVLYTLQLIPFYMLPASEKIPYVEKAISSKSYGVSEHEGILPAGVASIFRMVFNLSIISYTFFRVYKWRKQHLTTLLRIKENRIIVSWLIYLNTVLFLNFSSLVVGYSLNLNGFLEHLRLPTLTVMTTLLSVCMYLLLKPEILYGLVSTARTAPEPEAGKAQGKDLSEKEPKRILISKEQALEYRQLVEQHFNTNAPFLKPRYSIKHLADEVHIPSYLLSSFINQEYGKNFNEFINDRRVDHLIARVEKEPGMLQYTLEVLGNMGGFNSRTAFIEAVKRRTGKMPSEIFPKNSN